MWLKFRGLLMTSLFFLGGVGAAIVVQLLHGPGGGIAAEDRHDLPRERDGAQAPARVLASPARLLETPGPSRNRTSTVARAQTIAAPQAHHARRSSPASPATDESAPRMPSLPTDPTARIERLSYTALTAASRLERLVAVHELGAMAEEGDESGQIRAALAYSMGSQDPAVADSARGVYQEPEARR